MNLSMTGLCLLGGEATMDQLLLLVLLLIGSEFISSHFSYNNVILFESEVGQEICACIVGIKYGHKTNKIK